MGDPLRRIDLALTRARTRIRARRVVAAAAAGLQVGLIGAVVTALALRLTDLAPPWLALGVAAGIAATGAVLGAVAGLLGGGLDRRDLALLVDRIGGTDELVLTALHVTGTDDPNRDAILARVAEIDLPDPKRALPLRLPRHLRFGAIPAVVAVLVCFAPPLPSWRLEPRPASPLVEEGERLEERLEELAATGDGVELPEELERQIGELAQDLKGNALAPEEALDRLRELEEQLADHEASLQPSSDLLEELEQAARQLDGQATDALKEALEQGDLDAAADAAGDLSERLAEATPEERQRAAEALQQAGERLAESSDPTLQQAGQALKQAGGQQAQPSGLTPQQAEQLSQELSEARELGERLQRDSQALERAQRLRGAMEGSQQRLGDADGSVARGASSQGAAPGNQAGAEGHTWEDQGEPGPGGASGEGGDRTSDRTQGQHVDDFEKLYEAVRIDDAEALLAGAEGQLDARGHVDELAVRLTAAEETAKAGTVQLPEAYREAAAAAIEAEPIPPAYREAVKDYFDDME